MSKDDQHIQQSDLVRAIAQGSQNWNRLSPEDKERMQSDIRGIAHRAARGGNDQESREARRDLHDLRVLASVNDMKGLEDYVHFAMDHAKKVAQRGAPNQEQPAHNAAPEPSNLAHAIAQGSQNWNRLSPEDKERMQSNIRKIAHMAEAGDPQARTDLAALKEFASDKYNLSKTINSAVSWAKEKAQRGAPNQEQPAHNAAPESSNLVHAIAQGSQNWNRLSSEAKERMQSDIRGIAHRAEAGDPQARTDLAALKEFASDKKNLSGYIDFAMDHAKKVAQRAQNQEHPAQGMRQGFEQKQVGGHAQQRAAPRVPQQRRAADQEIGARR